MPLDDELIDACAEVFETESLGDGEVVDGVVDGRLTEEVLTQTDHSTYAQLLGHLQPSHGILIVIYNRHGTFMYNFITRRRLIALKMHAVLVYLRDSKYRVV